MDLGRRSALASGLVLGVFPLQGWGLLFRSVGSTAVEAEHTTRYAVGGRHTNAGPQRSCDNRTN